MADNKTAAKRPRSPGRPRDKDRERVILEETLKLLDEHGFPGLTVDAVVARAKTSKATIYRRWATKEEMAIAAFDLLPLMELPDTGCIEDDIISYIEQYTHFLKTTPLRGVLPALVSEAMHNSDLAERLNWVVDRRRASGILMIKRAIDRGELPQETNPELAQELIVSPMLHRSFFAPDSYALEDFRAIAHTIVAGLRAAPLTTSTQA